MTDIIAQKISDWAAKTPDNQSLSNDKDPSLSTTLIHGLSILDCFKQSGSLPASRKIAMSNAEISAQLGMNKATVSRLCKTLVSQNYLQKNEAGKFLLAPRILALSYPILSSMAWRQRASELMDGLAQFTQGNISLGVFSGAETVFIKTTGALTNFPHVPEIGMTTPLPETSTGRALLSMLTPDELEAKLAEIKQSYPEALSRYAGEIATAIESCQSRGFCVSFGDWRQTIYGASSPVGRTSDGLCVVISCGVPSYRSNADEFEHDLGPRLATVAENLRLMDIFKT